MSLQLSNYTIDFEYKNNISVKSVKKLVPVGIIASSFYKLWANGLTGKNIIVAIIDTGIDANHKDLQGKVIKSINLTSEPLTSDHGTHVAGTICANGWLIGGAYDCKLIDIKVITASGGPINNIIKAIYLSADNGANIINMSLGGDSVSSSEISGLNSAINYAWNKGCICIAAAGNSGVSINTPDKFSYPASVDLCESVAACETNDNFTDIKLATFSNENNKVDLAAVGRYVLSTGRSNKYLVLSGTSMAIPHVTSMAANLAQYIKQNNPRLTGSAFSTRLVELLHTNVYVIDKNRPINISFGRGFIRYEPNSNPSVPNGEKIYNNNILVGHLVDM